MKKVREQWRTMKLVLERRDVYRTRPSRREEGSRRDEKKILPLTVRVLVL